MLRFMRLFVLTTVFVCINEIFFPSPGVTSLYDQVCENLRNRIGSAETPAKIIVDKELIHASIVLPRFYKERNFQPAWMDDFGPIPQVNDLIQSVREAYLEGLKPNDYHLNKIEKIYKRIIEDRKEIRWIDPQRLADFDLLLTDSFLVYGSHLLNGRINPETFNVRWRADHSETDLAEVLQTALDTNRIKEALKALIPMYSGYIRLQQALERYRNIVDKGGWSMVPNGYEIRNGDHGDHVAALTNRLIISGDLVKKNHNTSGLFDDFLEHALLKFQKRHGLPVDGIVGPTTLQELNVSSDVRLRQIELNMERWRWLPHDLGSRYIVVNIADFQAGLFENGETVMVMKVVVGKDYRQTPVFSGKITYLVLCPYWHIPKNIAIEDKLPLIRQDPNYLTRQHIKVFKKCSRKFKEVDPKTINWHTVDADNFNYRLRQDPGPWNPLGRVKFMFPNKFEVHLHDTPSQKLFEKTSRTFSSGCIRIEKPLELAEYLLQGDPKWTRKEIVAAINKNVEQIVRIPDPIKIHLLYWTAWVNKDLSVEFRKDIYGRDEVLDQVFSQSISIP